MIGNLSGVAVRHRVLHKFQWLRWQIELHFKRYKSLLQLAQLRVKDPTLIQICFLCKILVILLPDLLIGQVRLPSARVVF